MGPEELRDMIEEFLDMNKEMLAKMLVDHICGSGVLHNALEEGNNDGADFVFRIELPPSKECNALVDGGLDKIACPGL